MSTIQTQAIADRLVSYEETNAFAMTRMVMDRTNRQASQSSRIRNGLGPCRDAENKDRTLPKLIKIERSSTRNMKPLLTNRQAFSMIHFQELSIREACALLGRFQWYFQGSAIACGRRRAFAKSTTSCGCADPSTEPCGRIGPTVVHVGDPLKEYSLCWLLAFRPRNRHFSHLGSLSDSFPPIENTVLAEIHMRTNRPTSS